MNERVVAVPTPSGRMEAFVTHPEQDGPFPLVILYMDVWGVREELFEIARRVGTVGYYCAGGVGAFGYCMGGRHVLCVAGHFPERIIASASLHGTRLISDAPDSPHLLVKQFRGDLYCGFAETDPYAPLSMVAELGELLSGCPVAYRHAIHAGALHGYALPNRDIFHPTAAARDWEMIFAMFHRQIRPYQPR